MISPPAAPTFLRGVDQNLGYSLPMSINNNNRVIDHLNPVTEQVMVRLLDTEQRQGNGQVIQPVVTSNLKITPTTHHTIKDNTRSNFVHH
jgi:hypothetical protein